jgi:hypothetical protein
MPANMPDRFEDVSVICKANIYFDGKVASHTILFKEGNRKTIGLIYPGCFKFNTEAPERMEITAGRCRVRQAGEDHWEDYATGFFFTAPGNASFEIVVEEGILEYICSFE